MDTTVCDNRPIPGTQKPPAVLGYGTKNIPLCQTNKTHELGFLPLDRERAPSALPAACFASSHTRSPRTTDAEDSCTIAYRSCSACRLALLVTAAKSSRLGRLGRFCASVRFPLLPRRVETDLPVSLASSPNDPPDFLVREGEHDLRDKSRRKAIPGFVDSSLSIVAEIGTYENELAGI